MAWRPPKRLLVRGKWVEVRQVDQGTLRDIFADDPDEHLYGGWDDETKTIYLLRSMSPSLKNHKYWHEVLHMLVDRFLDP